MAPELEGVARGRRGASAVREIREERAFRSGDGEAQAALAQVLLPLDAKKRGLGEKLVFQDVFRADRRARFT
jgi:hypothetical protein